MPIAANMIRRPDGNPERRQLNYPKFPFSSSNIDVFRLEINALAAAANVGGVSDELGKTDR